MQGWYFQLPICCVHYLVSKKLQNIWRNLVLQFHEFCTQQSTLEKGKYYSFWQLHLNFHKEAKLNMFEPSPILDFLKMDTHILFICCYYYYDYYFGFLNLACSCFPATQMVIDFLFFPPIRQGCILSINFFYKSIIITNKNNLNPEYFS